MIEFQLKNRQSDGQMCTLKKESMDKEDPVIYWHGEESQICHLDGMGSGYLRITIEDPKWAYIDKNLHKCF